MKEAKFGTPKIKPISPFLVSEECNSKLCCFCSQLFLSVSNQTSLVVLTDLVMTSNLAIKVEQREKLKNAAEIHSRGETVFCAYCDCVSGYRFTHLWKLCFPWYRRCSFFVGWNSYSGHLCGFLHFQVRKTFLQTPC